MSNFFVVIGAFLAMGAFAGLISPKTFRFESRLKCFITLYLLSSICLGIGMKLETPEQKQERQKSMEERERKREIERKQAAEEAYQSKRKADAAREKERLETERKQKEEEEKKKPVYLTGFVCQKLKKDFLDSLDDVWNENPKTAYEIAPLVNDPFLGERPSDDGHSILFTTKTEFRNRGKFVLKVKKVGTQEIELKKSAGGFTQIWDVYEEVE